MMLCVCLVSFLGVGDVVGLFDQRCCGLGFVTLSKMQFSVDKLYALQRSC